MFDIPSFLGNDESYTPDYSGPVESLDYTQGLSVRLRDSPETVRGWRLVALRFSTIPDPCYPPDWAIIRAAQESDPDLRYLCCRWIFKPEAARADGSQERVFTRHALGRYVKHPASDKELFFVERAADDHEPAPNQLDRILPDFDNEIVPPYAPLTWDVAWHPWVQLSAAQFRERYIEAPKRKHEAEKRAVQEEMAGRRKEAQKFWDKCLETVSDSEIANWIGQQRMAKAERLRAQRRAIAARKERARQSRKIAPLMFDLGGH